jgi:hypothetical protein
MTPILQQVESLMRDLYPLTQDSIDDAKVSYLLLLAHELLVASPSTLQGAVSPDLEVADNWRRPARKLVQDLLRRASWLSDESRQALTAFLEAVPAEFQVGPYTFTADWFSHKCEVQWLHNLGPMAGKPRLSFVEIGCFEGRTTVWLLENILTHASSRIVCIDPFEGPYGERFINNVRASGAARKVRRVSAYSSDALRRLRGPRFDFAYIDGDHRREFVLEDAVLLWPLMKQGGLITFDDYGYDDVRAAVGAFTSVYGSHCTTVHDGAQFTIRRTSAPPIVWSYDTERAAAGTP